MAKKTPEEANPATETPLAAEMAQGPENVLPEAQEATKALPEVPEVLKESLEAVTARSVVALFYAVEQLVRARNPEVAALLAQRRGELESAIEEE